MKLKFAVLIVLLAIYLLALGNILYYPLSDLDKFDRDHGQFIWNMSVHTVFKIPIPISICILSILARHIKSPLRFAKMGLIGCLLLVAVFCTGIIVLGHFDSEWYYLFLTLNIPIYFLAKLVIPTDYTFPLFFDSVWFLALIGFLQWMIFGFVLGLLIDAGVYSKKRVR